MKCEINPFFSVIVPVYNTSLIFLQECIDSVIKQECKDFELIIVDDGSNSNIAEFCDGLDQKYEKISVIHQTNQGVSVARNNGLFIAKGQYIVFLDADDMLAQHALIELKKICNQGYDVVFHAYSMIYADGKKQKCKYFISSKDLSNDKKTIAAYMLYNTQKTEVKGENFVPICTPWSKAVRREILINNKLQFNPIMKLGEDLVFNLYLSQCANSFYYADKELYLNRINSVSCVNSYHADALERADILANEIKKFIDMYSLNYLSQYFYGQYVILFCGLLNNYFVYKNANELKKYIEKDIEVMKIFKSVDVSMLNYKKRMAVELVKRKKFKILMLSVKFQNRYMRYRIH